MEKVALIYIYTHTIPCVKQIASVNLDSLVLCENIEEWDGGRGRGLKKESIYV